MHFGIENVSIIVAKGKVLLVSCSAVLAVLE